MILTKEFLKKFSPCITLDKSTIQENICKDDDLTEKLKAKELPLELELMLVPMWNLRSTYNDYMQPLDKAMESYMNFRTSLLATDQNIAQGTATKEELMSSFNQVLDLLKAYVSNQKAFDRLHRKAKHHLAFYSRATKDESMWNEMMGLRDIDYVDFRRKTCCFEHITTSLLQLVQSLHDSINSSNDIANCCENYMMRIYNHVYTHSPVLDSSFDEMTESIKSVLQDRIDMDNEEDVQAKKRIFVILQGNRQRRTRTE